MKKKNYNKFTKSDLPLESFSNFGRTIVSRKLNQGERIVGIGSKSVEKLHKKKLAKQQAIKEAAIEEDKKLNPVEAVEETFVERIERINEDTLDDYNNRHKRNQVIIIVLVSILSVLMLLMTIYFTFIKVEPNCFLYAEGAKVEYFVDGAQVDAFTAPKDIEGNTILKANIDVKVVSLGDYKVKFWIRCYKRDTLLESTEAYFLNVDDPCFELVDGCYVSNDIISYGDTIRLCGGVALNESELNVDRTNFRMEIYTEFEKVR